ncbi:hypothetical protein A2U01_0067789, partial [Trifolium medium]|nr:hypothetical protein [Trifolium medium]
VNKSRICDEDGRAKTNHYKVVNENRRKGQDRGKPYGDKNKKSGESSGGRKKIGGVGSWDIRRRSAKRE